MMRGNDTTPDPSKKIKNGNEKNTLHLCNYHWNAYTCKRNYKPDRWRKPQSYGRTWVNGMGNHHLQSRN